jgi:hypothetical protein
MSEAPVLHERDLLVLVKLLGMLGTENPHERAAAGAKVHAWVTSRGLEWNKLLIPDEPPEVEVSVNVGGRRPASGPAWGSKPAGGNGKGGAGASSAYASGPPFTTAQAAYAAHSQQQAAAAAAAQRAAQAASQGVAPGHPWANGPAWGHLVEEMLAKHAAKLKGDREAVFLADQLARAKLYGSSTRISEKQQAWLRDILGRAGLTW